MQFKKNLSSFSALTPVLVTLSFSASVLAAPFAYVPNEKSGTLSVIDTENDTVVSEIKAGDKPRGLAASIDGKTLYVSDQPNKRRGAAQAGARRRLRAVGELVVGAAGARRLTGWRRPA